MGFPKLGHIFEATCAALYPQQIKQKGCLRKCSSKQGINSNRLSLMYFIAQSNPSPWPASSYPVQLIVQSQSSLITSPAYSLFQSNPFSHLTRLLNCVEVDPGFQLQISDFRFQIISFVPKGGYICTLMLKENYITTISQLLRVHKKFEIIKD